MHTLVGSLAMAFHIDGTREPGDTDYFSSEPIAGADCYYNPRLELWDWGSVATLDELYTIKISHSFWALRNGTWSKHMYDIELMKNNGAQFIPELYKILYPIWEKQHGPKRVNLNAEPEDFFNNSVTRVYEHDSIHESIKYYDKPMFTQILKDGSKVLSSEEKFDKLSHEDKLKLVQEELFVIALERYMIPKNYVGNIRVAYAWALKRMITSMSKGWFPLWIVLHYDEVRKMPFNYMRLHKTNESRLIKL